MATLKLALVNIRQCLGTVIEEWGIEVSKSEGSKTTQKKTTESTNLGPWGLRVWAPTRVDVGAVHRPLTYWHQMYSLVFMEVL